MIEPPLVLFHVSDDHQTKAFFGNGKRPTFFWFGDRYHNHFAMGDYRTKYFHLAVKQPKQEGLEFRSRHDGYGFDGLWRNFLSYREGQDKHYAEGKFDWLTPEPSIIMTFSPIFPDLIAEYDEKLKKYVITHPQKHAGTTFDLFDGSNKPLLFSEVPAITTILPQITQALPFVEAKESNGEYAYADWQDMPYKSGWWL